MHGLGRAVIDFQHLHPPHVWWCCFPHLAKHSHRADARFVPSVCINLGKLWPSAFSCPTTWCGECKHDIRNNTVLILHETSLCVCVCVKRYARFCDFWLKTADKSLKPPWKIYEVLNLLRSRANVLMCVCMSGSLVFAWILAPQKKSNCPLKLNTSKWFYQLFWSWLSVFIFCAI